MIFLKNFFNFLFLLLFSILISNVNSQNLNIIFKKVKACSYEYYVNRQLKWKGKCFYKKQKQTLHQMSFEISEQLKENFIEIQEIDKTKLNIKLKIDNNIKNFILEEDPKFSDAYQKIYYYLDIDNKKKVLFLDTRNQNQPIIIIEYGKILLNLL